MLYQLTVTFVPGGRLGPYEIVATLGRGGMGTVFLAQDTVLHRRVALKVLTGPADDDASRAQLLREARNAAARSAIRTSVWSTK